MKRVAPLALALALIGCGKADDTAAPPSTFVTTTPARQGDATRWVTAYGTTTPASNGVETLSVPQPGQVWQILATAGSAVRAGQPILVFALAPSAQAQFVSAATQLRTAIEQRATTARLLNQQLATRDQLAQADKAVADAQAAIAAARREGQDRATQVLRAPFDGVVATLPVAQGDRTQPGAALATVARRGGIVVTVGVDPHDKASVRVGQAARLESLDTGGSAGGRVLRVDAQVNATSHLVDVDLTFPASAFESGQPVKAAIATGTIHGWVVPHAAVVTDDNGAHVFQVAGDKARAVSVTVLATDAQQDTVAGAIDAHLPLIVDGAYQVEDGGAVRAKK